jgi:hypothetical protein
MAFLGVLLLIGCGTSQSVKKSIAPSQTVTKIRYQIGQIEDPKNLVPEHLRTSILAYLKKELQAKGLLPGEGEQPTRQVKITIESYRMRSGFTRQIFGIFAGKDGVTANVSITDLVTGETLGESVVSSFNLAAVGGEEDIARMEGEAIARFLSGKED